jgi:hypothetical protein
MPLYLTLLRYLQIYSYGWICAHSQLDREKRWGGRGTGGEDAMDISTGRKCDRSEKGGERDFLLLRVPP